MGDSDGTTNRTRATARGLLAGLSAVVAAVVGYLLFVLVPEGNLARLLGVLLTVAAVGAGLWVAGRIASRRFPAYNAAEVAVEGPITRDGGRPVPTGPTTPGADEIVEQMERADEDPAVDALVVKLNTPGGEVVPSDDIRLAAERFDGPTVAYATDTCASGGYWIATGCDELWAREESIVGSIGVRSPRFTATGLLGKLGVEYQQIAAGEYKEAGTPFAEFTDDDREYLQGLVDGFYENFVERVAAARELDADEVRETEARVYLGSDAAEIGLVDAIGTREDVEDRVEERLGEPVSVREFEPQQGLAARLRGGASAVAYAFGAGLAGAVTDGAAAGEDAPRFRR
ncbi:MAG: signal peptide peptidase SppA [Haloarculaceae archaeon]